MKLCPPTSGLDLMLQMKSLTRLVREVTRSKQFECEEAQEEWAAAAKHATPLVTPKGILRNW